MSTTGSSSDGILAELHLQNWSQILAALFVNQDGSFVDDEDVFRWDWDEVVLAVDEADPTPSVGTPSASKFGPRWVAPRSDRSWWRAFADEYAVKQTLLRVRSLEYELGAIDRRDDIRQLGLMLTSGNTSARAVILG